MNKTNKTNTCIRFAKIGFCILEELATRPVCLHMITTLPHNLIEDKLIDLIERTFQREGSSYLACNDRNAFSLRKSLKTCMVLSKYPFCWTTFLYVVGIPIGTNCALLVADLFLFYYEKDFMMSSSDDKQAGIIEAFDNTSRYLDDISNINNIHFDNMVRKIYPAELQRNKANRSDTEASFLDLHWFISNDIVSTEIYDKRDDFDFEILNFPLF